MYEYLSIVQSILIRIADIFCGLPHWRLYAIVMGLLFVLIGVLLRPATAKRLPPRGKIFKKLKRDVFAFEQELTQAKSGYIDHNRLTQLIDTYVEVFTNLREYDSRRMDKRLVEISREFLDIKKVVEQTNQVYIKEESERHDLLFGNLDARQREACVEDEVATLVIAGAGSGKTRTIQKKVEYLIKAKGVNPNDILLLAFTNKAADEMTCRLREAMPTCEIEASTFHKFGLNIVKAFRGSGYDVADAKLCCNTVLRSLSPDSMTDEECRGALKFFAYYMNFEPEELSRFESFGDYLDNTRAANFKTIRGAVDSKTTFAGESVKSFEELEIANWLYLNGIEYCYEFKYNRPYSKTSERAFRAYKPDFYLPKYDIWIEHFGIDQDGNPPPYFSHAEKKAYIEGMSWKRDVHKKNGTRLIETYSWWHRDGKLTERLWEALRDLGVTRHGVDPRLVWKGFLDSNQKTMIREFARLMSTFISLAKSNRYNSETLPSVLEKRPCGILTKIRLQTFVEQAAGYFKRYEEALKKENAVDFHDMINEATDLISADRTVVHKYQYIIVDEFQDISTGRKDLLKALVAATGAKLFCVGDDWQSIYRFAGSDISIFTNFDKHFGFTRHIKLENTYRNSRELLEVAGDFVMKNRSQIKKTLRSSLSYDRPVVCISYANADDYGQALLNALEDIASSTNGEPKSVLLLGRHNHESLLPCRAEGVFAIDNMETYRWEKHPDLKMSFMTIHKAKGLEADFVILLNFKDDLLGLPNKIGDDPILSLLLAEKEDVPFAEERRVFYVALTRTKTRVYLLMPQNGYSVFFDDLPAQVKEGSCNDLNHLALCPKCKTGRLITRRALSTEGGEFYGCTNYPRCDYTLPIQKVPISSTTPKCNCGGFLVPVRNSRNGQEFLGCTEYKRLPSAKHIRRPIVGSSTLAP